MKDKKEKVVCYYHDDPDGISSAAIVKSVYPDAKFYRMNYSDEVEFSSEMIDKTIIVDFSFKKEQMEWLRKHSKVFCWIDHHKTAMEELQEIWNSDEIDGLRDTTKSGCRLSWEWFYPNESVPRTIELIEDYDIWAWKYGEKTAQFAEGIWITTQDPEDDVWYDLLFSSLPHSFNKILKLGESLLLAKSFRIQKTIRTGIKVILDGRSTFMVNTNHDVSKVGEHIYKEMGYPVALMWAMKGHNVICSLRSNKIDVGEIAKSHGGGGHKFAAGFEVDLDFIEKLRRTIV